MGGCLCKAVSCTCHESASSLTAFSSLRIRRKRQPRTTAQVGGEGVGGDVDAESGTDSARAPLGARYCGALPFLRYPRSVAHPPTSQAQMPNEAALSPPTTPDAVTPTADREGDVDAGTPATATSSCPPSNIDATTAVVPGLSLQPPAADDVLEEDENSSRVFRTRQMVESAMHLQVRSVTMHTNPRRSSWGFGAKRRRPSEFRSLMKVVQRNTRERGPPPHE